MLQLNRLNGRLLADYDASGTFPPAWTTMDELERAADEWVEAMRTDRGKTVSWRVAADRLMRTDRVEFFDRDDVDPSSRAMLAHQLHRFNKLMRSYRGFLKVLKPHLEAVHSREGRPARLLELASGSGEFTLALAELARAEGLPVEVTGSDIVPRFVDDANEAAKKRGLDVQFVRVNAFDMTDIEPGAYDVVFIAQALHHFSAGQVAMMIAQTRGNAHATFVGVDGYRSLSVLAASSFVGALALGHGPKIAYMMWHDSFTSARKFFPAAELELIARIAAPSDEVKTAWSLPYHSVLTVCGR